MTFLIDAQLPPALCLWLRERGHDAVHVRDIGLLDSSDLAIAARAVANGVMGIGLSFSAFHAATANLNESYCHVFRYLLTAVGT